MTECPRGLCYAPKVCTPTYCRKEHAAATYTGRWVCEFRDDDNHDEQRSHP